jgi:hypothetical protein
MFLLCQFTQANSRHCGLALKDHIVGSGEIERKFKSLENLRWIFLDALNSTIDPMKLSDEHLERGYLSTFHVSRPELASSKIKEINGQRLKMLQFINGLSAVERDYFIYKYEQVLEENDPKNFIVDENSLPLNSRGVPLAVGERVYRDSERRNAEYMISLLNMPHLSELVANIRKSSSPSMELKKAEVISIVNEYFRNVRGSQITDFKLAMDIAEIIWNFNHEALSQHHDHIILFGSVVNSRFKEASSDIDVYSTLRHDLIGAPKVDWTNYYSISAAQSNLARITEKKIIEYLGLPESRQNKLLKQIIIPDGQPFNLDQMTSHNPISISIDEGGLAVQVTYNRGTVKVRILPE